MKYCLSSLATVKKTNSTRQKNIPQKIFIRSQKNYILPEFQITHNEANNTKDAKIIENCFVTLGPIAHFSIAKLTKSSKKHIEKTEKLDTAS